MKCIVAFSTLRKNPRGNTYVHKGAKDKLNFELANEIGLDFYSIQFCKQFSVVYPETLKCMQTLVVNKNKEMAEKFYRNTKMQSFYLHILAIPEDFKVEFLCTYAF